MLITDNEFNKTCNVETAVRAGVNMEQLVVYSVCCSIKLLQYGP